MSASSEQDSKKAKSKSPRGASSSDEDDMPPAPPMPVGAAASSNTDLDNLLDEMEPSAPQDMESLAQQMVGASAKSKPARPPRSEDDDTPAQPPMLSASVGNTSMPPKSPPPIDDIVPSAQAPQAKAPMRSPPPLDELQEASDKTKSGQKNTGQISKEEQELGDVLKDSAPPLAPAQAAITSPLPVATVAPVAAVQGPPPLPAPAAPPPSSPVVLAESPSPVRIEGRVAGSPDESRGSWQDTEARDWQDTEGRDSVPGLPHSSSSSRSIPASPSRDPSSSSYSLISQASRSVSNLFWPTSSMVARRGSEESMSSSASGLESRSSSASAMPPLAPTSSMYVNSASMSPLSAQNTLVKGSSQRSLNTNPAEPVVSSSSMFVNVASEYGRDQALRPRGLQPAGKESRLQGALCTYSVLVTRCPCLFIFMYVVFFGALIGAAWRDLDIDSDFSSFIRADGKNMRQMDAYLEALAERTKKQKSRRLHDSTETLQWRRKNLVDLEGEGTGSWRRLRELTLDDVDVTSRDDAEWLMDFQDSGNGRLLTGTVGSGRRAQGVVATMRTLVLTYMPDNKNAFDSRLLKGVRDFEAGLRAMPAFQELCGRAFDSLRVLCDPGETFIAYTYPSRSQPAAADKNSTWFSLKFDATGPDMLQIPAALAVLQQSKEEKHDLRRFFPKAYVAPVIGTDVSSATPPVGFRTKYTFLMLVGRSGAAVSDIRAESDKVVALFDTFIKEEAFPYLQSAEIPDARVLYSGDVITSYEVSRTLRLDAQFALGSMAFVTVYMWFHTGSLILAVSCIITIITAVPLAYVLTPSSKTTVASFLSLFLVTGIGCDVVFVYIDCWEQSSSVEKIRERRLAWMMLHAGRNCLATSLTTAASFFANLASALQPLREFGLFMGLSVFGAFLLVAMFLPPLILLRENCCGASQREGSEEEGAMGSMAIVPAEPSRRPSRQISPANVLAQKVSKRRLCMQRVLMWLMGKIAACPKAVALFSCIALAVFLITVAALFEIDNEVPDIFPSDHNQIAEAKAQELFTVQSPLLVVNNPAESGPACLPDAYWDSTSDPLKSTCLLNWCESPVSDGFYSETTTKAPTVNASSGSSTLMCWWNKATPKCYTVDFRVRVASNSMPTASSFENAMGNHIQTVTNASAVYPKTSFVELSSLVRENWETGGMQTSRFFDAGKLTSTFPQYPVVQVGPPRPDVCTVSLICYQAGVERCDHPGWANTSVKNIQFETSRRLLEELPTDQELLTAPVDSQQLTEGVLGLDDGQESGYSVVSTHLLGRSLFVSTVPVSKRVDITVLWGVRPARSTPLVGAPSEMWSFDPTFEPSNPWAQRAIQAMCDDGNLAKYELLIISKRCFINAFKDHLDLRGKRFPTRDFESDINEWYPTTIFASEDLWRQGTQVQAGKISFILNLAKDIAAQPLLDHQKKWDDYLTAMNSDASVTANRPYHTAAAWVRAEAEIAVVASTVDTIIVSAVCAWLGMALFTQDLTLACLVLGLVLGIVCGLAFFIVVVVGWKFGSIEVISLVIFVGYSVTYSLHIAHSYAEARVPGFEGEDIEAPLAIQDRGGPIDTTSPQERRKQRTIMAIVHIGSAVFSSALSTLGSSIFLLCCTMIIFVKLGSVVIAVTLLSILCALIVLPAFLMILGPPEEAWHKRCLNSLRRTRSRLKGS